MAHLGVLVLALLIIYVSNRRRERRRRLAEDAAASPGAGLTPELPRLAMVVERSPVMRAGVSRVLEDQGYEVSQAENGAEGLRRLAELVTVSPSVLVVEGAASEGDGLAFVRSVRSGAYPEVRIIMVTPPRPDGSGTGEFEPCADAHLTRPFDTGSLVDTIRSLST